MKIVGEVVVRRSEMDRLLSMPDRARRNVKTEIQRLTIQLQNKVKSEKLNGQVLHRRTGTLFRSIGQRVEDNGDSIFGYVGTNLGYGIAHEFGLKAAVAVGAHQRKITQVWGRSISPKTISVSSFSRNVNMKERSFLRSSLKEFAGIARARIQQAIKGAV